MEDNLMEKQAFLYEKLEDDSVKCNLCNHRCKIKAGKRGICKVRENREGTLFSLVYGRLVAINIDPIEKKPLFHLLPSSRSFSIATCGCNFKCSFCQNADIAQVTDISRFSFRSKTVSPEQIVESAIENQCKSISYTYTEPTVFFEFAYDTAKLATQKGLKNIFVTNGYMTPEALAMISPYLDAANVDLKAYTDQFYKDQCKARLEPVKQTLKLMKEKGVFVEVTTLVIPGLNDSPKELEGIAHFISKELGGETPWHVSRFHPTHRLVDRGPTRVETLEKARDIGLKAGLKYVYTGNVPGRGAEDTICYNCGETVIKRAGFQVLGTALNKGKCKFCDARIDGVF